MTIIYSKNYSFRKKWELFIQKIIQLGKNYSTKYSFKTFENYSFKKIIHFFEKLIIAQGYVITFGSLHRRHASNSQFYFIKRTRKIVKKNIFHDFLGESFVSNLTLILHSKHRFLEKKTLLIKPLILF